MALFAYVFWKFTVSVWGCKWFPCINFVSYNLPNTLISTSSFVMCLYDFINIVSPANSDSFTSFPIWIPCISFSSQISMAMTFQNTLSKSGESRHPCLLSDINGNVSGFHLWEWCLLLAFIWWGRIPLCPFSGGFLS